MYFIFSVCFSEGQEEKNEQCSKYNNENVEIELFGRKTISAKRQNVCQSGRVMDNMQPQGKYLL